MSLLSGGNFGGHSPPHTLLRPSALSNITAIMSPGQASTPLQAVATLHPAFSPKSQRFLDAMNANVSAQVNSLSHKLGDHIQAIDNKVSHMQRDMSSDIRVAVQQEVLPISKKLDDVRTDITVLQGISIQQAAEIAELIKWKKETEFPSAASIRPSQSFSEEPGPPPGQSSSSSLYTRSANTAARPVKRCGSAPGRPDWRSTPDTGATGPGCCPAASPGKPASGQAVPG